MKKRWSSARDRRPVLGDAGGRRRAHGGVPDPSNRGVPDPTSPGGPRAARAGTAIHGYGFWLWILLVALASSIPYSYAASDRGACATPCRYDWIVPRYPEDGLAYFSWIKQAESGAVLFKFKYTALANPAVVFNPFFLLVGQLTRLAAWSPGLTLFVIRLFAVVAFLFILRWFLGLFSLSSGEQWLALVLVSCSSGWGGFLSRLHFESADTWLVDLNTLWSISWNALFVVALCLMLLTIGLLVTAAAAAPPEATRRSAQAGALCGFLAFVHPYDVVMVFAIAAGLVIARGGSRMRDSAIFFAIALPPATVQYALSVANPVLAAHSAGGAMASPSWLSIACGLGFPFVGAVAGTILCWTSGRMRRVAPLVLWVLLALVLSTVPFWFQRKLLFGLHVPVCVLGAVGLDWLLRTFARGSRALYAAGAVVACALTVPTHAYNFTAIQDRMRRDPIAYYVPTSYSDAFTYLERNSNREDVVLAHWDVSRLIPGSSGNTVMFGHWAQSVDADERTAWARRVFGPADPSVTDEQRANLLLDSPVAYVFIDPMMIQAWFGGAVPPWLARCGTAVFHNQDVTILKLERRK